MAGRLNSEKKREYHFGRGKPSVHRRFKKSQAGNLRGRHRAKTCRPF